MNILHVSSGDAFGGGERHVLELVLALAARGHRLHVATPADGALARRLREAAGAQPSVVLHPLRVRHALDLGAMWSLVRLVRTHRIDILHAHYARDYPVAAGVVRWQRQWGNHRPALFLTRHHYAPLNGHRLYAWWLSVAERFIAVSGYVRDQLKASLGWDDRRFVVIPNWVDSSRFRRPAVFDRAGCRQRFGLPRDGFIVGCLNRLEPDKGQATLLFALELARRQAPQLHLVLAGNADAAYLARLQQQARTAGLTAQVSFPGFVEDVPALLFACDVVAIPSRNEAFSLGVLEAWAAGVPVVVSDVGGLAELVAHEENGLRVGVRDVKGWAAALCRLACDTVLCQRLVRAGQQSVGRYTLSHAVVALEQLYLARATKF
ncbi:glycosyltransferase family 4 protein [Chloracidobacterium aggregatum]|jgi:glycosyltransferase involved in cell wall biosynthesis|uniref:Glycosyltransferase family 4 protein n=1 Tax=Chloracidobacterium sp. N TaxID=2821540 RepID=A0ABX8AZI4_9BACT|nr:glycosyltransferase family 4 protein [Chloracidobacterium aggregatum]QUV85585.1 glycosyltransferase family 4 protein [Chloracidobacterium sp. 2]QUV88012.1 glycosyltransferase family 4 protein [Chloracidobacterium sp. S]QUV90932.1 glycosyltransferase family 4 protein [Chloracidobacterium sp. A]QUV94122.1 glycosyltransferase family 4 protein [Chloracidobacterium sp. N]QUV97320.1 glycosyltransferase family 4 protein [Chloracidobacterium sp. E]